MTDESKTPEEHVAEALDLMVKAGWVRKYARDVKTGIGIDWTDKGKEEIGIIWDSMSKLGADDLTPEIWWSVRLLAAIGRPR
jgi:hypothetical protein